MSYPRYFSTRDPQKRRVSFEEALLAGLAPDGGLYLPDCIPQVDEGLWRGAPSIAELGTGVLARWLGGEVDGATLRGIVRDALDFPAPLVSLGDGTFVLELFHGPTLSFKDFGARTMARLMNHFLTCRGERLTILVATSGDTGSAVVDGFAGMANIEVVLLYPRGKVSEVQERQLIVKRPGVRSFAVAGSFDDCQRLVKEAFVDPELAEVPLSSANSINIGRLLPQTLYYYWATARREALGDAGGTAGPGVFCVPSGNLGNLTGGLLAHRMGLPVGRFIAAHNANDYFPSFLEASAPAYAFKPTVATLSNAMDVGAPSNFERLYALVGDEEFPGLLAGESVSDAATKTRMRQVFEASGYVACPHTAVGIEAAERYRHETGDARPVVVLATAHPAKFPAVVADTLGIEAPQDERLERLWHEPTEVTGLEPRLEALREVLL